VTADDAFDLGRAVARLEVALWGEGLRLEPPSPPSGPEVVLVVSDR
jgi:coenzyme F420-0:L-glutamate ligase/coenzyme F420-1:gamma-L-glutamate ligase